MIEQDTIKLLRECDAGIQMGVSAINDVLDYAKDKSLRESLLISKTAHNGLDKKLRGRLDSFHDKGKDPPMMIKGMSYIKTNAKLMADPSDSTVADLITDGCNMGIKSLSKYLNQYKAADEDSKNLTKALIGIEEKLADDMRGYL
ncbi:MAG: hypothetical protein E7490_00145 [Ruminococcaceae bacterium]|nr:hypothetical protein [Oscillospiraceae bacterium]MBP3923189.1 hypothetical protein [Ruminiclostridium sp.]